MSDNIGAQVHEFIASRFPQVTLADDDDIFVLGFVNSLFAMELVMFVEKTFSLTIPNDELRMENFRTVSSIAELIMRQAVGTAGSR